MSSMSEGRRAAVLLSFVLALVLAVATVPEARGRVASGEVAGGDRPTAVADADQQVPGDATEGQGMTEAVVAHGDEGPAAVASEPPMPARTEEGDSPSEGGGPSEGESPEGEPPSESAGANEEEPPNGKEPEGGPDVDPAASAEAPTSLVQDPEARQYGTAAEDAAPSGPADVVLSPLGVEAAASVSYLPATPITFILGSVEWDPWDSCYLYSYNPREGDKIKVTVGGTTHTFTYSERSYLWLNGKGEAGDIDDVQVYARLSRKENVLGSHSLEVDVFSWRWDSDETRGTVPFRLVESPLASLSYTPAAPIVLIKGVDSSASYVYDPSTKQGHTYHQYYFPSGSRLMGDVLELRYGDGTTKRYVYQSFKNPEHGYADQGYVNVADASDVISPDALSLTADQSYAKRWKAGRHAFTLQYQGRTTQVPVTVRSQTVTKVSYVPKKRIRRSTKAAIAYTKRMGIYDASYAAKAHRYTIVFEAPEPKGGDVLKVTESGKLTTYVFDARRGVFAKKGDAKTTISRREVTIGALEVDPEVRRAAFPCSYQGVEFTIPFSVSRKSQSVKAKSAQVVVGKSALLNVRSTGFADARFTFTSSNRRIATVDAWGQAKGLRIGRVTITVKAKGNAAYRASKAKRITVRVGKANPLSVRARRTVRAKAGKAVRPLATRHAQGSVTFANASKNAVAKTFKVGKKTGKVRVPKGTGRGTYALKVRVRAAGKGSYLPKTKTVTVKVTVA